MLGTHKNMAPYQRWEKLTNDQTVTSPLLSLPLLKKTLKKFREVVSKHLKVGSVKMRKVVDPFYGNFRVITEHRGGGTGLIVGSSIESFCLLGR